MSKILKNLLLNKIIIFCLILLLSTSAILTIYKLRHDIKHKIISLSEESYFLDKLPNDNDVYWAHEILKGGYILHFRHAERDKWIDVQMYDALESDLYPKLNLENLAENTYYANAVCLNERGKIQARAIGEHIKNINLPVSYVVSSPSCRARQTAEKSFGGYDLVDRILVHAGPYNEKFTNRWKTLKDFYYELPDEKLKSGNIIVSAHNGVLLKKMFDNKFSFKLELEEGGFYVISKTKNGLKMEHKFNNFRFFSGVFYER